jgi:RHS repeat-associated core domain
MKTNPFPRTASLTLAASVMVFLYSAPTRADLDDIHAPNRCKHCDLRVFDSLGAPSPLTCPPNIWRCSPGQQNNILGSGCETGNCGQGMPVWWVQEPVISMRLEDEPLGYNPALGPRISFALSYRQRGAVSEVPAIFGVGPNWSCAFRAYILHPAGYSPGILQVHKNGAGLLDYNVGTQQPFDGSIATSIAGGYQIEYTDGSLDTFGMSYTNIAGDIYYFMTEQADPSGAFATFNYRPYPSPKCCHFNETISGGNYTNCYFTNCTISGAVVVESCLTNCSTSGGSLIDCTFSGCVPDCTTPPPIVQLTSVVDGDGRTTTIGYGDPVFTNQITTVTDPFGRVSTIKYDSSGYVSNITDVASMTTYFAYDAGIYRPWITNMTTPYGHTGFRYGENTTNSSYYRMAEATPPIGGKHLYLYLESCTNFLPATYSPVPSTTPFANSLDNVDQYYRNSFEWGPMQYSGLSSSYLLSGNVANLTADDFKIARLRHWLVIGDPPVKIRTSNILSVERAPSPDRSAAGQLTWYDYPDKRPSYNNFVGSNQMALASFNALVLPDGSSRYTRYARGGHTQVTNEVSTYTKTDGTVGQRTNIFIYATNWIDLLLHIGPQSEQVVSNYFSNTHHQPDRSYDALSQETRYTYNANWQLTKTVNPAGLTTTNIYLTADPGSNMVGTTIDLEILRTNSYTYTNGLVYTHTDERQLRITNLWDKLQRLTRVSYPDNTYVSNLYTSLDLTATKDRMNYWTYFGYDTIRRKIAETNANGVVTRYGYCDCGALLYLTNAWNTPVQEVTQYGYDYQGNRTYIYYPDGYNITNWYNSIGLIYQTGDGPGYTYFYFNNQGLTTNTSSAYGLFSATIYDLEDRPLWVTDVNGVTVTNTYDLLGRLRTKTYPDQGVESFGYSARGVIAHTNQIGATNFFAYDAAGREMFETNANYELLRYTNNPAGDLLALTDGKNQTTRWNYDEYGRVTNKLDQAGAEILHYFYDSDSLLTNRWSAEKGNTKYTYDPVGNLTYIDYPNSSDVTIQYDWLNRVTNMVDAAGTTKYTYTSGNQLLTEDGPFASDTLTNYYLNRLRTTLSLQQPTGVWTNLFIFDAAKRLTNVTSPAGSFGYTLGNGGVSAGSPLINRIFLPNGSTIRHSYDSVARLASIKLLHSILSSVDSYTYAYDPANQRTNVTRVDGSSVAYRYDPIGQLVVADSSVNSEDLGYAYDAAWNLLRRTNACGLPGCTDPFTVDNKNQLTNTYNWFNYGNHDATYDANGNLSMLDIDYAAWLNTYFYDDENRLVSWISTQSGTPLSQWELPQNWSDIKTEFVYDGIGRLRQQLSYTNGGFDWALASATQYIYDGWRVIQERDANNTPAVSYTRGTDLGGSLEDAGGIGGLLALSDGYSGGNWTDHNYYSADGNGNVTYMEDSSKNMVATYRYDPFGNTISSSGTLADANVYRFSSKEIHPASGMYYYGFRFYDSSLQRWINRDPKGEEGFELLNHGNPSPVGDGPNAYLFVRNDPIFGDDPLGLLAIPKCTLKPILIPRPVPPGPWLPLLACTATFCGTYAATYYVCEKTGYYNMVARKFVKDSPKWTCEARCNVQQIGRNPCPPRAYGTGMGSSENEACLNAKRAAANSTPQGCYARHCRCICSKS